MAEINLLPEDLRKKETKERERIAKHPKSFDILLNQPDSKKAKEIKPATKESWWRKILGYPATGAPQLNEPPKEDKVVNGANWLKPVERKEVIKEVLPPKAKKPKQKKSWFSFLGSPRPLITSMPKIKEVKKPEIEKPKPVIYQAPPVVPAKEKQNFVTVKETKPYKPVPIKTFTKRYDDSWWQVLKSLFVPVKHQSENVRLASDVAIEGNKEKNQIKPQPVTLKVAPEKVEAPHHFETKPAEEPKKKEHSTKEHKKKKNQSIAYNLVEPNGHKNVPDVNLIPIDLLSKRTASQGREFAHVAIAVLVPVVILLGIYGVIFWGQAQLVVSMKQRNVMLDSKTKEVGDYESRLKKNNDLAGRITSIVSLRKNKLAWSNFFELLEKYTLDGVYYNNLSMDTSGSFLLPGVADSYETAAKQLALLNNASDFVKDAKISNIQISSDSKTGSSGISFQLRLVLADHVFSLKAK